MHKAYTKVLQSCCYAIMLCIGLRHVIRTVLNQRIQPLHGRLRTLTLLFIVIFLQWPRFHVLDMKFIFPRFVHQYVSLRTQS
jgi:hypothetical protein